MEAYRLWLNLMLLVCAGLSRGIEIPGEGPNQYSLLVRSTSGLVSGFIDTNTTSVPLNKWLGIPFAQTTAGKNRWKPPRRIVAEYSSVFNASAYGPACLQGRYFSTPMLVWSHSSLVCGVQGGWWQWNRNPKRRLPKNQYHSPCRRDELACLPLLAVGFLFRGCSTRRLTEAQVVEDLTVERRRTPRLMEVTSRHAYACYDRPTCIR